MTSDSRASIEVVHKEISDIYANNCCRKRVGSGRSLSMGFGDKKYHGNIRLIDNFYGEWELGTYTAAWRVVKDGHVLLGSCDPVDSVSELDELFGDLSFGRIVSINNINSLDIRVEFDCGSCIDFVNASSDDDEIFHIFGPSDLYVSYIPVEGWTIGKSNQPSA